ncbi:winged helix-turn-helix domain-containing protein [Staphylothermus hellenicus]|uniref:Transcriptional regulator, MarR family n=1 Tax=Staphylothermus hellenicus (strain DSM 12710 / JCM 10830 / BK20S6-10-b1 / P8) TaxID=591019 RepID=D7D8R9_STAHD|nr:winged helix-turn-helix domain-containing protein [Staphylothermus hellenicus]ADI32165.1 transcriptional regulator, MarR family [Staphylothermus hellenicus DSM 12710]
MGKRAFYRIIFYSKENGELEPAKIARQLGLQLNTIRKYLKTLEKEGLVERINDKKYQLTSKGLKLKKSIERLSETKTPEPYIITNPSTGEPLQLIVRDYKQLYAVIEYGLAPRNILEEHLKRGYFIEWIKNVFNDDFLAELIEEGQITTIDDLKNYLKEIIGLLTK